MPLIWLAYYPFVIGWSKYRLIGCLSLDRFWVYVTGGISTVFQKPLTVRLHSPDGWHLPTVWAVQGDCERAYWCDVLALFFKVITGLHQNGLTTCQVCPCYFIFRNVKYVNFVAFLVSSNLPVSSLDATCLWTPFLQISIWNTIIYSTWL